MQVFNNSIHSYPKDTVYVGRPSKWGNKFIIGKDGTRAEVISKYANWIRTQEHLMNALDELKGKDLLCWCAPQACHADLLLAMANAETIEYVKHPGITVHEPTDAEHMKFIKRFDIDYGDDL